MSDNLLQLMPILGGAFLVVGFIMLMNLFQLVERSRKVIGIAHNAANTLSDTSFDDSHKEKVMRDFAKQLFTLFFLITIGSIVAIGIPFACVWLIALSGLFQLQDVIDTTLTWQFLFVATVLTIAYFKFMRKIQ